MTRRPPPRPLPTLAAALVALALPSCGPAAPRVGVVPVAVPAPATDPAPVPTDPAAADPVDMLERVVGEAIARVRESAVALEYSAADAPRGARRVASGVVVGEAGEVLSVRIEPPSAAEPIVAKVASGRRLPARWVAADPETGLTLLQIEPGSARPAAPSTRGARVGVPVLILGNPFGLAQSVTRGFVAGLHRRLELTPRPLGGLIQVDASLHPGDSGALVADLHGGWLGVIRSGLTTPAASTGPGPAGDVGRGADHDLGFAIAAADVLWVAHQLRTRGRVDRAYLGVTMDRTRPAPKAGEAPDDDGGGHGAAGAVLGRVLADSPAERAGLKPGDRVVAIDGARVRSPYDLTDRLDRTPADAEVTLDLVRGTGPARQVHRLTFRAARRPPFESSRPEQKPRDPEKDRDARQPPDAPLVETIHRLERRIHDLERQAAGAATERPR